MEYLHDPFANDSVFCYFFVEGEELDNLKIVKGNFKLFGREDDEDARDFRDKEIFLQPSSHSELFVKLRMGLYYKGLFEEDLATENLLQARSNYFNTIHHFIIEIASWVVAFTENIQEISDSDMFTSRPDPPIELLLEIEEMPSFHLGVIYLEKANNQVRQNHFDDAKDSFVQAINYFKESDHCYSTIFYGHNDLKEIVDMQPLLDGKLLNLPEAPFKRNYYLEDNLAQAYQGLKQILAPGSDEDWESIKKSMIDLAAKEELELIVKGLRKEIHTLEEFRELVEHAPLPLVNELKIHSLFRKSKQRVWWIDKHFSYKGLKYLNDSDILGKVKEIKILTGNTASIDDRFKEDFSNFKKRAGQKNTMVSIRIINNVDLLRRIHDRYLICDENVYNVPPVGSLASRQYAEIKPTDRVPPFDEWWEEGSDI